MCWGNNTDPTPKRNLFRRWWIPPQKEIRWWGGNGSHPEKKGVKKRPLTKTKTWQQKPVLPATTPTSTTPTFLWPDGYAAGKHKHFFTKTKKRKEFIKETILYVPGCMNGDMPPPPPPPGGELGGWGAPLQKMQIIVCAKKIIVWVLLLLMMFGIKIFLMFLLPGSRGHGGA